MGDPGELQFLTPGEGVANLDSPVIVQADDIPGYRLFYQFPLTGLESYRIGDLDILAQAHVTHLHALGITPGTHPHKGDAIPVARVHISLDLEHETAEPVLVSRDTALNSVPVQWFGSPPHKIIQHFPHPEITQGGTEEYRA